MTVDEIYKSWPFRIRFLRRECWELIYKYLLDHQITNILEFGSGISTILFNSIGIDVVSYETDPVYLRLIKSYNLANVEFRLWDNITAKIDDTFGLSLVDGILPRLNQLYYAQKHSRYIAIDDYTDNNSNMGLEPLLSGYTNLTGTAIKLAIFRKI